MRFFKHEARRGAVAPLFAILAIPLLGMMAFAIDVGYMTLVQTDLQTAADAAALAGAEKLQSLLVQYNLPLQTQQQQILSNATTNTPGGPMSTAQKYASSNKAGNVFIQVPDQDISFGFMDATGKYTSPAPPLTFPNTISVTTRRDAAANGPISLFFGPIFGMKTKELTATARATIYSGDVASLQVVPGVHAHILPVALDRYVWQTFYTTGQSPDGLIHSSPLNGYAELQVYPTPGNAPGNFGLIDVGPPANNVPAFRNWIDDGETPNDIAYLANPSNNLLPVSTSSPKNWKAGPGLKSTLLSNFQLEIGTPTFIPLFEPVSRIPYQAASSTGQNATYAVVGFVGITISEATGSGNNMNISIQPMAAINPTAVIPNPTPAGTTQSPNFSTTITTFISAKLTQ
jgi:Flp pilus assembly protein TadG